jgi:hypothetical protein
VAIAPVQHGHVMTGRSEARDDLPPDEPCAADDDHSHVPLPLRSV